MSGEHESNLGGPIGGSQDQIWPPGAFRGPPRAPKGAFRAKTGPFRTPGGPEGARYQVKVCGEHESNPGGPVRGSRDQIWSLGAPREPQKGHFGPKRALLGRPGAQKGPDTRSKCVVSMSSTQAGQWEAVGTKSGPSGPSEDLRGPQKGHSGPRSAVEVC